MTKPSYRIFDHTADFGLEIFGQNPSDLFEQAAAALTDLLTDASTLTPHHQLTIEIKGQDWEDLLINWLRELLYLYNGDSRLVAKTDILTIEQTQMRARVFTDVYTAGRHEARYEIKAVTYHQIEVKTDGDVWKARVIFDI